MGTTRTCENVCISYSSETCSQHVLDMCWACSLYHVDMNGTHVENIFVLHMFKYSPWLCSMMHYAHRENVYVLEVCSHIEWHEHVFYIHRCCIMREHFCSWSVACVFCKCPDTDAASRGSQALIFGEHVVLYVCSWCGPRYEMMGAGILVYPIMHTVSKEHFVLLL